jgi:hypothetical protein
MEQLDVSPQSREMVSRLLRVTGSDGAVDGATWKQNLQEIVQQGTNSIPAIREFLSRNTDVNFNDSVSQTLGYGSVRTALFDALTQIGGPQAVDTLSNNLQTSTDPREIANLAKNLDKLEPGQHQQDALEAARQALDAAMASKSPSASDVAPLFEVLQKYGDANVVSDLEKAASHWNMYAAVTLAQMPDGAGIPSLVRLAQGQEGGDPASRAAAVQMLAEVAPQSADARTALLELARANKLSDYNWGTLEPVITGSQYYYQNSVLGANANLVPDTQGLLHTASNQNLFFARPTAALPPDQIAQRTTLIDDLMAATSNATAIQMLQRSRAALAAGP